MASALALEPQQLREAIVSFALDGKFPDDITSLPPITEIDLQPAIDALQATKTDLETEISVINEESKEDVITWARNAKTLQEDVIRSKTLANDVARQAEAPDLSGEAIHEAEEKSLFLNRELQYSQQLRGVLGKIKQLDLLLKKAEAAKDDRRVLDSLQLLEQIWTAIDATGVSKSCRIIDLLHHQASELKSTIYEVFSSVWKELIRLDVDNGKMFIQESLPNGGMTLAEAVIGLKTYKETDERVEQLWRNLDGGILSPRLDASRQNIVGVRTSGNELALTEEGDESIQALLSDLEVVFVFLREKLPSELMGHLESLAMPEFIPKLIQRWLNPHVPSSLAEIPRFQSLIGSARSFCITLEKYGYTGLNELEDWVNKSHLTWLGHYRETTLGAIRSKLSRGIGEPRQVEKVEKHMVTMSEGKELATTGAGAAADSNDWGAAWDEAWDDEDVEEETQTVMTPESASNQTTEEDDGTDAWGWGDEDEDGKRVKPDVPGEEDGGADAWGWGEDETTGGKEPAKPSPKRLKTREGTGKSKDVKKELILKEKYHISSMPDSVLELITTTLEDGATLTKEADKYELIASTAPGLFSLPTFSLALYRAIAPFYYSLVEGGSMYLYNDAVYIAERLFEFAEAWKERQDLTPRARSMLRLDNDIKTLQNFANRSYANEMSIQRTVLQDLLGGSQGILQQDEPAAAIEGGISRIRQMAATWDKILARSVWSQAVGSLVDALASHLIAEVLDMSSIGQDEAYNIASLMVATTALDDLFLPSNLGNSKPNKNDVPTTEQYAPNWPRLKYLSEILQSDLKGIRALWCDQKLSYYFTEEEVIDLIHASFEDNPRTRQTIKDIKNAQYPAVDL